MELWCSDDLLGSVWDPWIPLVQAPQWVKSAISCKGTGRLPVHRLRFYKKSQWDSRQSEKGTSNWKRGSEQQLLHLHPRLYCEECCSVRGSGHPITWWHRPSSVMVHPSELQDFQHPRVCPTSLPLSSEIMASVCSKEGQRWLFLCPIQASPSLGK